MTDHALAAARHEREVARALGSTRTARRGANEALPDLAIIETPHGDRVVAEAKLRRRLPRLIVDGLAQASRYAPTAIPMLVLRERGGSRDLAVVDLHTLVRWAGFVPAELPTRARPTRRRAHARQLELLPEVAT